MRGIRACIRKKLSKEAMLEWHPPEVSTVTMLYENKTRRDVYVSVPPGSPPVLLCPWDRIQVKVVGEAKGVAYGRDLEHLSGLALNATHSYTVDQLEEAGLTRV